MPLEGPCAVHSILKNKDEISLWRNSDGRQQLFIE